MEFSLSEDQRAIVTLADTVLNDCTEEINRSRLNASEPHYHRRCWQQLIEVGLVGVAVPVQYGGSGLTFVELCLVVEQLGRHLALTPFVSSTVFAGLVIARFGSPKQKQRFLQPLACGEVIMSAATATFASPEMFKRYCYATPIANGWSLEGMCFCIPFAAQAQYVLVPALDTETGEQRVFIVDPALEGAVLTAVETTHSEPQCHLELQQLVVSTADCLDGKGEDVWQYLTLHVTTAFSFLNLGIAEEALQRTAQYTAERQQFGRAIGSFQGVAMRAADAFIDIEAIRVSCWQAAWRLSQGKDSEAAVRVAKWWASEAASRVVHTAQHLHGGVGADKSYPIHRYFLAAKNNELALGAGAFQLSRLGELIDSKRLRQIES